MTTGQMWRTTGGRWLVDQVDGEPGVRYRVWDEGELAIEIDGTVEVLATWLERVGIHIDELAPAAACAGCGVFTTEGRHHATA